MNGGVKISSSHLVIHHKIVQDIFGGQSLVLVYFAETRRSLLLVPISEEWFKKLYKAQQLILKSKNISGDKSLDIRSILIDEGIDDTNRDLNYTIETNSKMLNVKF